MKKRTRESALPDITPLIDVVFLLLIFFMVATVFKKDELALLLSLPKTETGKAASQEKKTTIIEVTSKEIAFNGAKLTLDGIEARIKAIADKTTPIEMRVDKDVRYDRLMNVLDKLKKYELTNLSLITDAQ